MHSSRSRSARIVFFALLFLGGCTATTTFQPGSDTASLPQLQLKITKVPAWEFRSRREAREIQKNLNSTNKTLNYLSYHDDLPPFLTLERKRRSDSEFQTTLSIDRRSLGEYRFTSSEKALAVEIGVYLRNADGAQVTGATTTVNLAGETYVHGQVRYPLGFKDGRRFNVERHFWIKTSASSITRIEVAFDATQASEVWSEVQQMITSLTPEKRP